MIPPSTYMVKVETFTHAARLYIAHRVCLEIVAEAGVGANDGSRFRSFLGSYRPSVLRRFEVLVDLMRAQRRLDGERP